MADYYGNSSGGSLWPDAQSGAPIPVESPEDRNADTEQGYMPVMPMPMPMVQPLIVVPYSGQMQPLSKYSPDGSGLYDPEYGDEYYYEDAPARARGVCISAIIGLILCLASIAFVAVGYFLKDLSFLYVLKNGDTNMGVIDIVMGLFSSEEGASTDIKEMLIPIGLIVYAAFTVLTLIINLVGIKAQRYPIIGKIFGLLAMVGAILSLAMMFMTKETTGAEIQIGAYILTVLSVLTALIVMTGRRKI